MLAQRFKAVVDSIEAHPAGAIALRVLRHPLFHLIVILAIYVETRKEIWGSLTVMPASTFDAPVITFRALFVPRIGWTMAALVVLAALCFRIRWTDLESGRALRIAWSLIVVLSVLITAGMPYNFLTGQMYIVDRLLVVAVGGLVIWRPGFAPLLLAMSLIMSAQQIPSIDRALNWTERRLLLDVQIAFAAFMVARLILNARTSTFVLFALAVLGASYWYPGVNKMTLGEHLWTWAFEDDLGALFVSTYVDGWLPGLGDARAAAIGVFLGNISPLLCTGTLLVELTTPLLFFKRRLSVVLLLACVGMHLGIFASSGIFFYKWIVVDIALAFLIWRAGSEIVADWRWPMRIAGAALVIASPFVLSPYELGWFDTRLSQVLRIEAVLENGGVREVSPTAFKPFDVPLAQGRFHYVADHTTPVGVFGAVQSAGGARRIAKAGPDGAKRMLSGSKKSSFDAKKAARFDKMVQRYFRTANANGGRMPLWWLPGGLPHIVHSAMNRPWHGEKVKSVRVRAVDWYFDRDNARLVKLNDVVVREIDIKKGAVKKPKEKPVLEALHARDTDAVRDRGSDMTFEGACDAKDVKTVALLGDVVFYKPMQQQAFAEGYESIWGRIADLSKSADATWANIEGTLSCCFNRQGEDRPDPGRSYDDDVYTSGSKTGLNMHPDLAKALKDLGVDVVQTANNHSLDRGARGAVATLDALDAAGLAHTGTRRSKEEPWYALTNVDGMRVAWLGCSEWSNNKAKSEQHVLLNCVEQRDEVLALVKELATRQDVDALLFFPSGGKEKRLLPDARLRDLALEAAELGAAAVIGFHTHHLQTWEKIRTKDGREVPLIWNRGNFVTFEHEIEQRTFALVNIGLAKDRRTQKARVVALNYIPLFQEMEERPSAEFHRRWLIAVDRERGHEAARALAMSRFGKARLHPPTVPVDMLAHCKKPDPPPWQSGPGELCIADAECAAPLACLDIAEAVGLCTQRCVDDAACPAASTGASRCATEPAWGEKVCLRTCASNLECPLHTKCLNRDGQRVCALAPR